MKSKVWQPRNGCDGRMMAKNSNSGEYVVSGTNSLELSQAIEYLAINLPSQQFLDCHLYFYNFITQFLGVIPFLTTQIFRFSDSVKYLLHNLIIAKLSVRYLYRS